MTPTTYALAALTAACLLLCWVLIRKAPQATPEPNVQQKPAQAVRKKSPAKRRAARHRLSPSRKYVKERRLALDLVLQEEGPCRIDHAWKRVKEVFDRNVTYRSIESDLQRFSNRYERVSKGVYRLRSKP